MNKTNDNTNDDVIICHDPEDCVKTAASLIDAGYRSIEIAPDMMTITVKGGLLRA